MRLTIASLIAILVAMVTVLATAAAKPDAKPDLRRQVFEAESSFAHTMAARDHKAFGEFVALDAIFFGRRAVMRGRTAVSEGWKPLFQGSTPPFSWRPEVVEVLESGALAHSSGRVLNPAGKLIGKFNSVWRLERDGHWRVVFDKGCEVCDSTTTR
jgi:ketosteroid isomerase-like protein